MKEELDEEAEVLQRAERNADPVGATWTEVAKRRRKVKKNLLVKTFKQDKKATKLKREFSQALQGIQMTDSRFTNGGNIVMNFDDKNIRSETAPKLEPV